METLAVKYRPSKWEDVTEQGVVVKMLKNQIETGTTKNAYVFCGASGCGKTTCARIFASSINGNFNDVIEIDAASNNGVDNVRSIIQSANERAIYSKYKIFIMDEAHMLSISAWNAMLKILEEPPKYTIFIFCTTDPNKIPDTIMNRVQRYDFNKISFKGVVSRLSYICDKENIPYELSAIEYAAKIANGCMRDAISTIDKCSGYFNSITVKSVVDAIGDCEFDVYFNLLNALIDGKEKESVSIIEDYYNDGKDLKLFVDRMFTFVLGVTKFLLFGDLSLTNIPSIYDAELNRVVRIEDAIGYYNYLQNKLLDIRQAIKSDIFVKETVEVYILQIIRGI